MTAFKVLPAPLALKDEIKDLPRQTFKEHQARQPWAFTENAFDQIASREFASEFRSGNTRTCWSPYRKVTLQATCC